MAETFYDDDADLTQIQSRRMAACPWSRRCQAPTSGLVDSGICPGSVSGSRSSRS